MASNTNSMKYLDALSSADQIALVNLKWKKFEDAFTYRKGGKMKKFLMLISLLLTSALVFALTVDGLVTDADTGDPIEGANVKFVLADGTGGGGCGGGNGGGCGGNGGCGGGNGGGCGGNGGCTVVSVTTNVNGYYEITDLEAGVYDGIANKPGSYPAVRIEDIEITNDLTINFELEPGGCLIPETGLKSKRSSSTK